MYIGAEESVKRDDIMFEGCVVVLSSYYAAVLSVCPQVAKSPCRVSLLTSSSSLSCYWQRNWAPRGHVPRAACPADTYTSHLVL